MPLTWLNIIAQEIIEFLPLRGIFMDQSFQKILLVWTHLDFQTYTSSILFISFFFHHVVNLDSVIPEAFYLFVSNYLKIWSLHRNWNPNTREEVKVLQFWHISKFQLILLENSFESFINFWIDAFILLHDSYIEASLVLFLRLAWILPSRSPSSTFVLSKMGFSCDQLLYVQSIISVPPWRKVSQCDCPSCKLLGFSILQASGTL